MPSKITKVSTIPERHVGDRIEVANSYRCYKFANDQDKPNYDQVPQWMDAVINAPVPKPEDPDRFKNIWP